MLEYFQPLINYIHQHPQVGELIAFLVALTESLPLIGTIIPGSITMTAIGTLVGAGIMPGITTLVWASSGAFVGDTIGFWVGYYFTDSIPKMWPFRKHPQWLGKSEIFFEKHGGKSIILGRFVGPARSTIPMVAGLLRMKWPRFIIAAIPSAILWAILYMVPGILLGVLALELPPHIATGFIIVGLVVIVGIWLVFWFLQYFFTTLAHWINVFVDNAWDWLIRHRSSRPFIRLIAIKGKPTDHYQLTLSILAIIALILFLWLFYAVVTHASTVNINQPIFYLMQSLRTKSTDTFFILITLLATSTCMLTISILISIGLAFLRQWRSALHLLALSFLTAAVTVVTKHFSHNPRPTGFQILPWGVRVATGFNVAKFRYTPFWPQMQMRYQQWWNHPLYYLPTYRLNRFGNPVQPFNLQWAGKLKQITALLKKHDWQSPDPRYTVKSTLNRFTSKKPEYHMPLLPWLYHHKPPVLILIKQVQQGRSIAEFRLWDSNSKFTNRKIPLWIGTVNYHVSPEKLFSLHHFQKEISRQESGGIYQLINDLSKKYQLKHAQVLPNNQPKKVRILGWNGHVLIIRPSQAPTR